MKKIILVLIFILSLAINSNATTYWISPTGAAANLAACSGATPLEGTAACSYDKANGSGVVPGDTVYYRAGTYSGITDSPINPYNTGTPGNIITFSSYNNEDVQFVATGNSTYAVNLDSEYGTVRSYIKVNDLHFTDFHYHLWIKKGTHNEISYCSFTGYPSGRTYDDWNNDELCGTYIYRQAQYNWIHHNTFTKWGYLGSPPSPEGCAETGTCTFDGSDKGGTFCMGLEASTNDLTKYNLVENNNMSAGGHHVAYINGSYNIYRNNYFHNEPWYPIESPVFSTRVVAQEGYGEIDGIYNLNEGNRIGYGGPKNKNEVGGLTTQIKGAYNIWRYNIWAQSYLSAILLTHYTDQTTTQYNKIYNNTFWKGGYGNYQDDYDPAATLPTSYWHKSFHNPVNIANSLSVVNNTFKNNLFYQNHVTGDYTYNNSSYDFVDYSDAYSVTGTNRQIITNNWLDNSGDPMFMDITATADPTIDPTTQWDFSLQSSSTAIDAATYLTQANGSGTDSTTLIVDANTSSYFFYDVGGFATEFPSANVNSDQICIGTVSNCVAISSINYATDTITLASAMTWSDNANVWLYKNSAGTQVLYGNAPDYGAFEYDNSGSDPVYTVTVSKTGASSDHCFLSHTGDYEVATGATQNVSATIDNGHQAVWSGTCPSTGGVCSGNSCTTRVCTPDGDDKTMVLTCTQVMVWP